MDLNDKCTYMMRFCLGSRSPSDTACITLQPGHLVAPSLPPELHELQRAQAQSGAAGTSLRASAQDLPE
jgi:hypothetical protein